MRKHLLLSSIAVFIAFAVISGCKKEKKEDPAPPPPPPPTKTDHLTKAPWKFDHATAGGIDISNIINACLKDNIATFTSAGNATLDESAVVCSPSYAGTYTWAFQSNETVLHISGIIFPGGNNDFTLISLNETNLVVSQVMTFSPYPPTTVEVTFKH